MKKRVLFVLSLVMLLTGFCGLLTTMAGAADEGSKKTTPQVTPPVGIQNLSYDGTDQTLVSGGSTTGGRFQYAVLTGNGTPNDGEWSYDVPTGKKPGTYYVMYRIVGDEEYADVEFDTPITVVIRPKIITLDYKIKDKYYDGTTQADVEILTDMLNMGIVDGDKVGIVSYFSPSFYDKNVGENKPVYFSGFSLVGNDKGNYVLEQPVNLTASIFPRPLAISGISVEDKEYDGTVEATISETADVELLGIVGDETVMLNPVDPVATFTQPDADDNIVILLDGFELSGPDCGNYVLKQSENITANITKRPITITAGDETVEYKDSVQGTYSITGAGLAEGQKISSVQYNADTGVITDEGTITPSDVCILNADGSASVTENYEITYVPGKLVVLPRTVTIAGITSKDKTYDGTDAAELDFGEVTIDRLVDGENVSVNAAGVFNDVNAGEDKEVTITGLTLTGEDADHYVLDDTQGAQQTTAKATIFPKKVTVGGLTATDRDYADGDKSVEVIGGTVEGLVDIDDDVSVDLTNAVGEMENADAGENKAVSVSGVGINGIDAGNYALSMQPTGVTVTINRAASTVTSNPIAADNLAYTGSKEALLVDAGEAVGGTMLYALGDDEKTAPAAETFDETIPEGKDAGTYYIWFMVKADGNHTDTAAAFVAAVKIAPKVVDNPTIAVTPDSYVKDGEAKEPAITVYDGDVEISADAYEITYADNVEAGTATVTIIDKTGGNYTVSGTATFVIKEVYTVVWLDADDKELDRKTYVEGETEPTTDKVPTREEDTDFTYTFSAWDNGTMEGTTKTHTPVFKETKTVGVYESDLTEPPVVQIGSNTDLTFKVWRSGKFEDSFERFRGITFGKKTLVKGVDFMVKKGSTIITIPAEVFDDLEAGEQSLKVSFDNGELTIPVTIVAAEPETEPTEPETEPAEPETEPTEPETEPTEPETEPAEPETEPTEPETKPVEPETKPSESETKTNESGQVSPKTGDTGNMIIWMILVIGAAGVLGGLTAQKNARRRFSAR